MSWVSVPSQRSAIVHLVPRTVAALYLPLVRELALGAGVQELEGLARRAAAVTSPALAFLQMA